MLIGINFPKETTKEDKVEQLREIVSEVAGKVRIYEPSTLDKYVEAVKQYDARQNKHLILLNTHYNYADSLKPHDWRMHEYYFDFKGGTQWGVSVDKENITYREGLEIPGKVVTTATWAQSRAEVVRGLTAKYMGSATFEPHTLIIGYGIEYPASSYPFKCLLGSLPDEWWTGVALLRLKDYNKRVQEHFEFSNVVTLGDTSHEALTELGIEHGAMPKVPYDAYHGKVRRYSSRYGAMIREVARTKEDARDWTE